MTPGAGQDTLVLEYNNAEAVQQAFAAHPGEIAAVILEPVVGNMGCVPGDPHFLKDPSGRDTKRRCGSDF